MNGFEKSFIYLSQIIGLPVVNINSNEKIGKIDDVAVLLKEMYPKVSGLIIKNKKKKFYLSWIYVKKVIEDKAIYVENPAVNAGNSVNQSEEEMLLKETFWDKQIVDISGAKVVRVNDLHLLREGLNFWVVHMNVGFRGLLLRLGCYHIVDAIFQLLFSYEIKDNLISWKYVQPIKDSNSRESLHLKIQQPKLSELHPADLSDILMDLGVDERKRIFLSLDKVTAAKTLHELPLKIRIQVAESLPQEHLSVVLKEMPMDEVVDLLAHLPKKLVSSFYSILPKEKVSQIKDLLSHSEHIAGSIMNTDFMVTKINVTANDVLNNVKAKAKNTESFYYVYVLDDNDSLIGIVTLRQLLSMEPTKLVSDFMRKRIKKVKINTDVKKVAQMFSKYNFYEIPVIDKQNKIMGIITLKDAFEAVYGEIKEEV
ncbi:MAG: CBS domain-containing protein [Elusimicrobia bacterium]|nr:CBS domain-containing protein [Elusimicrobiota bacterium]